MMQNNIFKKYPNRVFVETGSYLGDGIKKALEAGFSEIHSIELSNKYADYCHGLFAFQPNVFVHGGDSGKILGKVIENINEPATFWLDGHWSAGDTAMGRQISPLIEELLQIEQHPIKTHTILIDDMRCWRDGPKEKYGFDEDDILSLLMRINSDYKISFEDGCSGDGQLFKNDILVAQP